MASETLDRYHGHREPIHLLDNHSIPCRQREFTDSPPQFSIYENLPSRFLPVSDLTYFFQHTRLSADGSSLSILDEPDQRKYHMFNNLKQQEPYYQNDNEAFHCGFTSFNHQMPDDQHQNQ